MVMYAKDSLGKISFTADIWTDCRLRPFLAVTAHWIQRRGDGSLLLRADLIAFHHLPRSHTGKAICQAVKEVLERANVVKKVCTQACFFQKYVIARLTPKFAGWMVDSR
jgi:hypothetical protein